MQVRSSLLNARLFLAAMLTVGSLAAMAQPQGQPTRLRGTVQALDGQTLTVLRSANEAVKVSLPESATLFGMESRSLSDIKDGDFIGVTASAWKDGRLHATEVHIFPESMRGAGEGHYPWDFPDTTMTNATVTGVMAESDGRTVKLNYKDGQTAIDIGPDTPIVLAGHSHVYERSFMLDGHYGTSDTLEPYMVVDGGDGQPVDLGSRR